MKRLNLNTKISTFIAMIINIICSFFLIYFSFEGYKGIEFDYNTGHLIFTALSFICLSVIMQNRTDCLFIDNNLIRLSRIGSRRKALIFELLKTIFYVFIYECIGAISVCIFAVLLKENLRAEDIAMMFILGYLIKLFLIIIQFIMDRIFTHNIGFMIICLLFLTLLLAGSGIYYFCENAQDTELTSKLLILNKLNLINYISISRTNYLTDNILYPLSTVIGLNIISITVLFIKIKKLNLIPKE